MNNLEAEIQSIYDDFRSIFNQESFPETFELINHLNQSAPDDAHKYGYYAILYTPVIYRPTFMIVGNNPSWFDKDSNDNAQKIVKKLMKCRIGNCF